MDLMFIEEIEKDKNVEQQFVEAQTIQINASEENIVEVETQPSTKMQTLTKSQLRCRNPNLGLTTKVRACEGVGQV